MFDLLFSLLQGPIWWQTVAQIQANVIPLEIVFLLLFHFVSRMLRSMRFVDCAMLISLRSSCKKSKNDNFYIFFSNDNSNVFVFSPTDMTTKTMNCMLE